MSKSLQEQFQALGLAKKKKPAEIRKARKPRAEKKPVTGDGGMSLSKAYQMRAQDEKQTAKAKREKKRADDLLRRQVNAKIQLLADAHTLNDKKAEIKRNFLYKGRIRRVLVTPEQMKALNAGALGVVFIRGNYILMLPEHVDLVRAISEDHVPDLVGSEPEEEDGEFKVPDDLSW